MAQVFSPVSDSISNVTRRRGREIDLSDDGDQVLLSEMIHQARDQAPPNQTNPTPDAQTPHADAVGPTLVLDGLTLRVASSIGTADLSNAGKLYNKLSRDKLPPDQMNDFRVAATKCVLRKRLAQVSVSSTDEGALENVCNLHTQIQSLRDHLHLFDLDDVFHVVQPVNCRVTSDLHPKTWNVFEDYVSLDPAMVANSIAYYHLWLYESPYIRENLSITYAFLKNNTDEALWNKCLPEYERFPPEARGGPLMLLLILQRIQNTTESALTHLVHRIEHLKISDIEGENVETVATLVKAALTLVDRATARNMVRLPFDFPKTLLKVYQTSSVPEFNEQFRQMLLQAQQSQDLQGGDALWPSVDVINTLAKNSYLRMLNDDLWTVPANSKAYHARNGKGKGKGGKAGAYSASTPSTPSVCWNCGGSHLADVCPKPRNQALFDANKAKWLAANPRRRGPTSKRKPLRKVVDGKPMIRNKNGVYVADVGLIRKQAKEAKTKTLLDELAASLASLEAGSPTAPRTPALSLGSAPAPASNLSTPAPGPYADRASKTCALVQETFDKFLKL
jgi:hypothetical protein